MTILMHSLNNLYIAQNSTLHELSLHVLDYQISRTLVPTGNMHTKYQVKRLYTWYSIIIHSKSSISRMYSAIRIQLAEGLRRAAVCCADFL